MVGKGEGREKPRGKKGEKLLCVTGKSSTEMDRGCLAIPSAAWGCMDASQASSLCAPP